MWFIFFAGLWASACSDECSSNADCDEGQICSSEGECRFGLGNAPPLGGPPANPIPGLPPTGGGGSDAGVPPDSGVNPPPPVMAPATSFVELVEVAQTDGITVEANAVFETFPPTAPPVVTEIPTLNLDDCQLVERPAPSMVTLIPAGTVEIELSTVVSPPSSIELTFDTVEDAYVPTQPIPNNIFMVTLANQATFTISGDPNGVLGSDAISVDAPPDFAVQTPQTTMTIDPLQSPGFNFQSVGSFGFEDVLFRMFDRDREVELTCFTSSINLMTAVLDTDATQAFYDAEPELPITLEVGFVNETVENIPRNGDPNFMVLLRVARISRYNVVPISM